MSPDRLARIKGFFDSLGIPSALMAGFAFTAIIEIQPWAPVAGSALGEGAPGFTRALMYAFLVASFAAFMTPLLLNTFFLNIAVEDEENLGRLRKVQFFYTMVVGVGLGGLEGALCIYVLGTFSSPFAYLLCAIVLASLVFTLVVMRWFKVALRRSGSPGEPGEKSSPPTTDSGETNTSPPNPAPSPDLANSSSRPDKKSTPAPPQAASGGPAYSEDKPDSRRLNHTAPSDSPSPEPPTGSGGPSFSETLPPGKMDDTAPSPIPPSKTTPPSPEKKGTPAPPQAASGGPAYSNEDEIKKQPE